MNKLLEIIIETTGLEEMQIRSRARISRQVSDTKILFCHLAYEHYRKTPVEIAAFLNWPRQNVYHLLAASKNKLEVEKEYRSLYRELKERGEGFLNEEMKG